MRYLVLALMMSSSLLLRADWIRGTITLQSGVEKTGYIKDLKSGEESVIEFKVKIKDQSIEVNSEDISEMLLWTNDGKLVTKFLLIETIGSNGEYKSTKSKCWMRVAFRGDFDVMCLYNDSQNSSDYYVNWPGENSAHLIYIDDQKGVIAVSKEELLRKSVSKIFTGRCDIMVTEVNTDQFDPKGIGDVLRYYVEHCKAGLR